MAGFIFKTWRPSGVPAHSQFMNRTVLSGKACFTAKTPVLVVNGKAYTLVPAPALGKGHDQMMNVALKAAAQFNSTITARGDLHGQLLRVVSVEVGALGADRMTLPFRLTDGLLMAKPVDSGPVRVVAATGADASISAALYGLGERGLIASINAAITVVSGQAVLSVSGLGFGTGHTATR